MEIILKKIKFYCQDDVSFSFFKFNAICLLLELLQ